jgi:hypothetical protein
MRPISIFLNLSINSIFMNFFIEMVSLKFLRTLGGSRLNKRDRSIICLSLFVYRVES